MKYAKNETIIRISIRFDILLILITSLFHFSSLKLKERMPWVATGWQLVVETEMQFVSKNSNLKSEMVW